MWRTIASQLTSGGTPTSFGPGGSASGSTDGNQKGLSPSLQSDIYKLVGQVKAWIIGGVGSGSAGDGFSYNPILNTIRGHLQHTEVGIESVGSADNEIAVVVGAITSMLILEFSQWEGMTGVMAMNSWVDALVVAYGGVPEGNRKDAVARGISRGLRPPTDVTLFPKELTVKIQIISILQTVSARIYGADSHEAGQARAAWAAWGSEPLWTRLDSPFR